MRHRPTYKAKPPDFLPESGGLSLFIASSFLIDLPLRLHIIPLYFKHYRKRSGNMEEHNLVKKTLDQIPQATPDAKHIVGLVKEGGRITGYQLSENSIVEKQQAVGMAKQGQIAGVGIAHLRNTEYLKSIPDGSENNNLGNLPSVSPQA